MIERLLPHGLFLGLPICLATTQEFIETVCDYAAATPRDSIRPLSIAYLNAWTTVYSSYHGDHGRRLRDHVSLVYADGMGTVWGGRYHGVSIPERINAADFIETFLARCQQLNLRIFLLGGAPGVATRAKDHWESRIPGLNIVGVASGYNPDLETAEETISNSNADIILIGMGTPLQEQWMVDRGPRSGARVLWCVGAMMEFHSGTTRRAPVWMRKMGLEWLFRLAVEPGRMWRRYILGNAEFLYLVLRGRPVV